MKATIILMCLFQSLTNAQDTAKTVEIEFIGTYCTGRGPCEWLSDGARRWAKTAGFTVDSLIIGDLEVTYIEIAQERQENSDLQLIEGEVYKVAMALSTERFLELELADKKTIMSYQNPILKKEITRIKKKVA